MTETGHCQGCADAERLGSRRLIKLLATGTVLALAGCANEARAAVRRGRRSEPPLARTSPLIDDVSGGPPVAMGQIPPPRPGAPEVLMGGPSGTNRLAWTLDDGYCGPCIAGYVEFAEQSGLPMTFNPNGTFQNLWTPPVVSAMRRMVANRQVQLGNHTWDHADLTSLPSSAVIAEITRNEDWIEQTFGVTARPYWRPPYGYYNNEVMAITSSIGYTKNLMWNGTLGDATPETPQQIIQLAEQWLQPGTILLSHLNHPPVLSVLPQIDQMIRSRNLEPVTLDEMFGTSRETG